MEIGSWARLGAGLAAGAVAGPAAWRWAVATCHAGLPAGGRPASVVAAITGRRVPRSALAAEVTTVGLSVAVWLRHGDRPWVAVAGTVVTCALVALSVVDVVEYRIPRRIVLPATAATWAVLAVDAGVDGRPGRLVGAAAGAAGAFAFLFILAVISPRGMGMGDVWLQLLTGTWLGYLDPPLVIIGLLAGSALGVLGGLVTAVVRRANRPYPFGPYLAAGALVAGLWAPSLGPG